MKRIIDTDRLRQLALAARNPGGYEREQRLPARYLFDATVTATHTGPNRVDLDRHGTAILNVRYLASYSPTVADVVRCEYVGDELMIWGKFA